MDFLTRTEELILLSVYHLADNAYGVTIRNYLQESTGRKFSIGGTYVPLDRLVRKGFLATVQADPTPERGGMSKRYFQLTQDGVLALEEIKKLHEKMWQNVTALSVTKR